MVLFRRCSPVLLLALLFPAISWAGQDPLKDALQGIYNQTLTAMRSAKTVAEIRQIVNRIDMPQSTRIATDGQVTTVTAEQTIHELEGQVADPNKEIWKIDVLWAFRVHNEATAVAWIYTKSNSADVEGVDSQKNGDKHPALFGTIIRDKWVLTKDGWRRNSHEKLFPDRILAIAGKDIVPPE
jgi:hypothetical protein